MFSDLATPMTSDPLVHRPWISLAAYWAELAAAAQTPLPCGAGARLPHDRRPRRPPGNQEGLPHERRRSTCHPHRALAACSLVLAAANGDLRLAEAMLAEAARQTPDPRQQLHRVISLIRAARDGRAGPRTTEVLRLISSAGRA